MIMSPLPLLHRSSKVGESGKWGEWESGNIRPPGFHVFTFKRRSGHCALRVVVRPEGDGGYRGTALSTHSRSPCALRGAGAQGPARWAEREPWQPPSWPGELVGGNRKIQSRCACLP